MSIEPVKQKPGAHACIILHVVRADVQKHLRCLSRAADSIAVGDTIDAVVRRGQKWNMLPTQVLLISWSAGGAEL